MKNIVAYQVGHDSSIVGLSNGKLIASIEGEKDSNARFYTEPSLDNAFNWLARLNKIQTFTPDVISILGWAKIGSEAHDKSGVYMGLDYKEIVTRSFFGKDIDFFYSTHEKAHIFLSYALSPFPQGQPVYCLTWEGFIGTFYKIDQHLNITKVQDFIPHVGEKYSFLYVIAGGSKSINLDSAGKIMALASFAKEKNVGKYKEVIDYLLFGLKGISYSNEGCQAVKESLYEKFGDLVPFNKGVTSQEFKEFAWAFQERILEVFIDVAKGSEKIPLLISGGCGLNCYWNQRIKDSGIFQDVFVPPCPNDSGIAIGLAAEAQFHYTGNAKIEWDVYAGEYFNETAVDTKGFTEKELDYNEVAQQLSEGNVIAWIQGRYEIGPRALCNRSLIAAPFTDAMLDRLNSVKSREAYRPIAPACLEEDAKELFGLDEPSPHMLYFSQVLTPKLKTVTHIDNTARVQTISKKQNEPMHNILTHFKNITGYGVLCNTSLNFNGKGFINNTRDAFKYARERGLNGIAINNKYYLNENSEGVMPIGLALLPNYDKKTVSICIPNLVISANPLNCSVLGILEITDWSLYDTLKFDFNFESTAELKNKPTITLYADNNFTHELCMKISNSVTFVNNTSTGIVFNFDSKTKERLKNVTNLRLVFNTETSVTAEARISNVVFSIKRGIVAAIKNCLNF